MKKNKFLLPIIALLSIIILGSLYYIFYIHSKPFVCGDDVTFTYNGEKVTYGTIEKNDLCWMDRNLGASQVCTSFDDEKCYGDLFQWGRGDDGHQIRTSSTTVTLSSTDAPGHSDFIINDSSPWYWRSTQNNDLWQGVDGINNPCPEGWRVPTETELNTERGSWSSKDSDGAFNSTLKWSVAGLRYNDSIFYVDGSGGSVWSSTVTSAYSRYLVFGLSDAFISNFGRANGLSVRCLRD